MSITRAFTTRRVKQSLELAEASKKGPQRSNTTTNGPAMPLKHKPSTTGILRHKISAPIELVHTTNMLSYNAPDLFPKSAQSTASSAQSDDGMSDAPTNASSPPTSPDVPPQRSMSPEPNHLSCYFTAPGQAAAAAARQDLVEAPKPDAPVIPQRAPSHTKKASYEALNRQRSVSRMSEQSSRTVSTKGSMTFSRSSSASTSTTATSHTSASAPQHYSKSSISHATPPPTIALPAPPKVQYQYKKEYAESHPFGQELAQVSELAEEFAGKEKSTASASEETALSARGLFKFSAEDYITEIQSLISDYLGDARPVAALWI